MANSAILDVLLEAEVAPQSQPGFEKRYLTRTGISISPGTPPHYQCQTNKWGAELRAYFNDADMATLMTALEISVESGRSGYKSGEYSFRINDNNFWWKLVEVLGLRLGVNKGGVSKIVDYLNNGKSIN